jgi:hypothetical protein
LYPLFRTLLIAALLLPSALVFAPPAQSSEARIVRLSFVEGDVRFAREIHGDPLTDATAVWDTALLNLPLRQGNLLATGNGRAAVEFENGAMAFLAENTVLEFYDLSLQDGAFTTRLVLRQGSAEFYVNPASGDYFSVTGGDFTVEATERVTFRMNNFDDGSSASILQGRAGIRSGETSAAIEKGQSYSMTAGNASSGAFGRAPEGDDFDRWVSSRIESVQTATEAARSYSDEANAVPGYADLYSYGSWYAIPSYGWCWRPFGVAAGWSPFEFGGWIFDPIFGWVFVGGQPWGWLPFHYGGWVFDPGFGWVWTPGGTVGAWWRRRHPGPWRPVTAVFVHTANMRALVPMHPNDVSGKTPLNLAHGVYPVAGAGVSTLVTADAQEHWKTEKKPARDALAGELARSVRPEPNTQSVAFSGRTAASGPGRSSSIVYDAREHRYINSEAAPARSNARVPEGPVAGEQAAGRDAAAPKPAASASGQAVVAGSAPAASSGHAERTADSRDNAPPARATGEMVRAPQPPARASEPPPAPRTPPAAPPPRESRTPPPASAPAGRSPSSFGGASGSRGSSGASHPAPSVHAPAASSGARTH